MTIKAKIIKALGGYNSTEFHVLEELLQSQKDRTDDYRQAFMRVQSELLTLEENAAPYDRLQRKEEAIREYAKREGQLEHKLRRKDQELEDAKRRINELERSAGESIKDVDRLARQIMNLQSENEKLRQRPHLDRDEQGRFKSPESKGA